MNTPVKERELFRRPRQTSTEDRNKLYPAFRRVACQGNCSNRRGRPVADVSSRRQIRIQVGHTVQEHKHDNPSVAVYPIIGNNTVETVRYIEPKQFGDQGLIWINHKQYFKGVPPEVWNFRLGGSQICQKWLKDRQGRELTNKDIQHYQRIVTALKEMIELMAGIDAVIERGKYKPQEKIPVAANTLTQVKTNGTI